MNNRTTIEPTLADRVYATLADNPASTSQELAALCGLTAIQTGKQITAMKERGKAAAVEKRVCRVSGRWTTSWRRVA
jgi:hypothetical protein